MENSIHNKLMLKVFEILMQNVLFDESHERGKEYVEGFNVGLLQGADMGIKMIAEVRNELSNQKMTESMMKDLLEELRKELG